jgi:hypothetical protein
MSRNVTSLSRFVTFRDIIDNQWFSKKKERKMRFLVFFFVTVTFS